LDNITLLTNEVKVNQKEQIQKLKEENANCSNVMIALDKKIKSLRSKLEDEKEAFTFVAEKLARVEYNNKLLRDTFI